MEYEIDHLFVLTDVDASDADTLVRFGLTEGPPNRHAGQGTANRRFFFDDAMLEFLWVESEDEARSLPAQPLRLADRWKERSMKACPFGICLRAGDIETVVPPFQSFEYRPAFFPAGLVAHIAQDTPSGFSSAARVDRTHRLLHSVSRRCIESELPTSRR
jgi:hypothetical protein